MGGLLGKEVALRRHMYRRRKKERRNESVKKQMVRFFGFECGIDKDRWRDI